MHPLPTSWDWVLSFCMAEQPSVTHYRQKWQQQAKAEGIEQDSQTALWLARGLNFISCDAMRGCFARWFDKHDRIHERIEREVDAHLKGVGVDSEITYE